MDQTGKIIRVEPAFAIPGGEIVVTCEGFRAGHGADSAVFIGDERCRIVAASASRIWFYDMTADGFSLDDKRQKVDGSDIPDILDCWNHRKDAAFYELRKQRREELKRMVAPMKAERLDLHREINRLMFEGVVAPPDDDTARLALETDEQKLAELEERIAPVQDEINLLGNQFWVTKAEVTANKFDLSASRYRKIDPDETFYEDPGVTLERLAKLEQITKDETEILLQTINSLGYDKAIAK